MNKQNKILTIFAAGVVALSGAGVATAAGVFSDNSAKNVSVNGTTTKSISTAAEFSAVADAVAAMPAEAKAGKDTSTSKDTKVDLSDVDGTYKITKAGTYYITGSNADAQIVVDADADAEVTIYLNGVDLTSKSGSAIQINSADKVKISTVTDSVNLISDTSNSDSKAAIYSKTDLNFKGEGTLVVLGNNDDAIYSSDDLQLKSGTVYAKTTVNDAFKGKDSISIEGGTLIAVAADKGLNSNQDNGDTDKSVITQTGGKVYIQAGGEGGSAATIDLQGGESYIDSGDDSWNASSKVLTPVFKMSGGQTTYHAGGDGIDSNGSISVTGGIINANMDSTSDNEPLDADSVSVTGGTIVAGGSNNAFPSADYSYVLVGSVSAGDKVTVKDSSGNTVGIFTATEDQSNLIVANTSIKSGQTYSVQINSDSSTSVTAGTGADAGMGAGGMGRR